MNVYIRPELLKLNICQESIKKVEKNINKVEGNGVQCKLVCSSAITLHVSKQYTIEKRGGSSLVL